MKYIFSIIFLLIFLNANAQENNGISVNQLADNIIRKYDQDKDGVLDVTLDSFLREDLETGENDGEIVKKTESRGLLFSDADQAGNKDGKVTKLELLNILDTFDENSDGQITWNTNWFYDFFFTNEWGELNEKYEERSKYEYMGK